ncbi:MAG: TlpA family protein disulfide reductase [Burkholderiales bacterium]|nr:TlpA family protein disulfide reductase [Nitrosomonas sp.]MCP5273646.1 TlpA family protein disulfide reductase [Burkholderiales bacterium]
MNNLTLSDVIVDKWVQDGPVKMDDLLGSVVLVEVFQVNCPGCFFYALPNAVKLYQKYHDKGLVIIALATAFEDYDKNTLENLELLVKTGEVIGETFKALNQHGLLVDNSKLPWKLPFPVGMDRVEPDNQPVTDERVLSYARRLLEQFDRLPEDQQQAILNQIRTFFEQKIMKAETFERFSLQGTPSAMLFDRKGQLHDVSFGQAEHKQSAIEQLLAQN